MKRHFSFGFKALAACAMSAMLAVSCYDDSALWDEIEGLEERVAALEDKLNSEVATLNSKIGAVETAYKAADAALLEAVEGLTEELDALDGTVDGYIKSNDEALKAAIDELKKADAALAEVDTDVLLSLTKLGVVSVEKDKDGKVVITFVDESTLEIANEAGVVTIVDGKWAVVVDGEVTVLDALVHPDTTLDFRVGDDNTLYVSYDGKNTWESTGVVVNDETTFNVVEGYDYDEEAGTLTLTIAGEDYVLPIYQPDNSSLVLGRTDVFFNYGATKTIYLEAEAIVEDECYVIAKPDGWKATLDGTVLTVTAPSEELVENGIGEIEGEVLVHATTVTGTCKVVKLDVSTGIALTISYENGNVTVFNALSYTRLQGGWNKITEFYDARIGISPVEEFMEYDSFDEFVADNERSLYSAMSYYAMMNDLGDTYYVPDEREEQNITLPLSSIAEEENLELDENSAYVLWILPMDMYGEEVLYEHACYVLTSDYASFNASNSTYNNADLEITYLGADGFYIGAANKTFIDTNMEGMLDMYLEYGPYWQGGPFADFKGGNAEAMGTLYKVSDEELGITIDTELADVVLPDYMGNRVVDADSEYYVWLLPYYEGKPLSDYTLENLIKFCDFKTKPLVYDETVVADVQTSPTPYSYTFTITPPENGTTYYYYFGAGEYEEYWGDYTDEQIMATLKQWCYEPAVEDFTYEVSSWEGIMPGNTYTLVLYSTAEGKYGDVQIIEIETPTLSEYVASLEDGATFQLLKNATIEESIVIDKKLTIDLNKKTLTAEGVSAFNITTAGDLTISNGNVTADKNVFHNEGTLTINSGTYTTTGETMAAVYCDGPRLANGGATDFAWHLTINGGTFVSEKFTCISLQNNYWHLNPEGSATLNAGTFTAAENWYGLFVDCAKVNVDVKKCAFTNTRTYVGTTPTCSTFINGLEYTADKLFDITKQTPDNQQWIIPASSDWEYYAGANARGLLDLSVNADNTLFLGINYRDAYGESYPASEPEYGLVYHFTPATDYVVTPTDLYSGTITFNAMSLTGGSSEFTINYSDYDGESCTFEFVELDIFAENCTPSAEVHHIDVSAFGGGIGGGPEL